MFVEGLFGCAGSCDGSSALCLSISRHDGARYLVCGSLAERSPDQCQSEINRGPCAARGDEQAIFHHALRRQSCRQFRMHREMRSESLPTEQTGIRQHRGRGADGRHRFAGRDEIAGLVLPGARQRAAP